MDQPRRRTFATISLVFLLALVIGASFWFGMVSQSWSPFPPISLETPGQWFTDPRLAALRFDRALCRSVLRSPHIEATAIPDEPIRDRCGWSNAVRISSAGGTRIGIDKLTCETAAALALWIEYDVQPAAVAAFGKRVASVQNFGTYSCRTIIGNPMWKNVPSQHATANAIDISGFALEDGTQINVKRDWRRGGKEGDFLRSIHQSACRLFRVALSPDFNEAHHDHFHFDRGFLVRCK